MTKPTRRLPLAALSGLPPWVPVGATNHERLRIEAGYWDDCDYVPVPTYWPDAAGCNRPDLIPRPGKISAA